MNRLQHSFSGYRRSMQMSVVSLFVFVEGFTDRYIYSQIADSECRELGINYRLVTAEELQGGGGKTVLLSFFAYLKRRGSLVDIFQNKTTASIFFLDKDVDDFLRVKRRSDHVVYTETYDIESYLFIHGDLCQAAAASASLDIGSVRTGIGDYNEWRYRAAATWKNWVTLCLFAHTRGISSTYYGRPDSQINDDAYSEINESEYELHCSELLDQSGWPSEKFQTSLARWARKVERIYADGLHDRVFKGRWYIGFLVADLRKIAGRRRINLNGIQGRLLSGLAQSLNFDDAWAEYFKTPIRNLINEAQLT